MPSQGVRALPQMFSIRGFHSRGQLSSQPRGSSSRALLSHLTALPKNNTGSALSFQRTEGNYPWEPPYFNGTQGGTCSHLWLRLNTNDNDDFWSGALSAFCKQARNLAVTWIYTKDLWMPIFLPVPTLSSTLVSREWKLSCAGCRKALARATQLLSNQGAGRDLQTRSVQGLTCSAHAQRTQHRNQTRGLAVRSETWSHAWLSLACKDLQLFSETALWICSWRLCSHFGWLFETCVIPVKGQGNAQNEWRRNSYLWQQRTENSARCTHEQPEYCCSTMTWYHFKSKYQSVQFYTNLSEIWSLHLYCDYLNTFNGQLKLQQWMVQSLTTSTSFHKWKQGVKISG